MKRLLLLGGGHSHVEVLRRFGARPLTEVEITFVSPARFASYSGMLPGLIAGHYGYRDCHIDLERLARYAGAQLLPTSARGIDTQRRRATLTDGTTAAYDVVSIDVGTAPATAGIAGAPENAIALKPVETFLQGWNGLIGHARTGKVKNLAVVGGGTAGVETLLAMQFRLAQLPAPRAIAFALIADGDRLLPGHNPGVRAAFERILVERRLDVHLDCRIVRVEQGAAIAANGKRFAADAIIWAAGAGAPPRLFEQKDRLDASGFITVNEHLQSIATPEVFAAGDCATIRGHSYPKSGVYAVRQGPPLAENLRRALTGKPLLVYRPQRNALALISTGNKFAVASYGPLAFEGAWIWRWKNRIDRAFLARYNVGD